MENSRLTFFLVLYFISTSIGFSQNKNATIAIGAHKSGVSIGEPIVYNKGKTNIGFLNRFKGANFSADFYFTNDTLCQNDFTQVILSDSSFLNSKRFTLEDIDSNNLVLLDSVFKPQDTGWHPLELTVKLGRRRKKEQSGFYVLPRPFYIGEDSIDVCEESNTISFVPEFQQCDDCTISFPNTAQSLDSVQLTITKDTLYTFSFENNAGCVQQQSVWFNYHPTPYLTSIKDTLTICNEDTVNIGYSTNGVVNWLSHSYQGTNVDVQPNNSTVYYAYASSPAGCVSELDTIVVYVNQLPIISLQDSNYVCVGLSEQLTPQISGNGGYQYLWNTGDTTKDISISDATNQYSITVTDINGCIETQTVYNQLIDYAIDAGLDDSICFGESYELLPLQGNYLNIDWTIGDSSISNLLNLTVAPELSTTYILTTSNDSGCLKVDSVTISVDSLSVLEYSISGLNDLKIGDTLHMKNENIEQYHDYTWMIDGVILSTQNDSASWIPVFDGNYSVTLLGQNSLKCPIQKDSIFSVRDILPRDYERIIYPNPTLGLVNYNVYSDSLQTITVSVLTERGREVYKTEKQVVKGMNTLKFDIGNEAAGKYYIMINSDQAILKSQKPWIIKL